MRLEWLGQQQGPLIQRVGQDPYASEARGYAVRLGAIFTILGLAGYGIYKLVKR